ncbi:SLAM family member 5-like [Salminus brasiliensis]|uniref:SLAM family member 5-like n=1 Tax=Salminus brasiliensis TaxID=930266 RepID=UPI003B830A6A
MMAMVMQLIFFLAVFNLITGSRDVPVLVGRSVQLDIQDKDLIFNILSWKHNENSILQFIPKFNDVTLYDPYKHSVEFNKKTYSLTLKTVQKNYSGLYEAQISGQKERTVVQYNLTVFDPVEAPALSHQQNNITCNITLTCRVHDLSISSNCYNEICDEKIADTSPRGFMLSLSVRGSSIICNHSNPADWKEDVTDLETFRQCGLKDTSSDSYPHLSWPVLSAVMILIQSVLRII